MVSFLETKKSPSSAVANEGVGFRLCCAEGLHRRIASLCQAISALKTFLKEHVSISELSERDLVLFPERALKAKHFALLHEELSKYLEDRLLSDS
jgi:hypothetical protein